MVSVHEPEESCIQVASVQRVSDQKFSQVQEAIEGELVKLQFSSSANTQCAASFIPRPSRFGLGGPNARAIQLAKAIGENR